MAVPKVKLNLDEVIEGGSNDNAVRSIVASSIKDKVEEEKCVVAQYRTTLEQKNIFMQHLSTCHKNNVPIEWVIDIADESNGWFYGTAYHFDDSTQMLHVMVPDKVNPSFDGKVLLDHRTVHVIECVDGRTDALFNKIIRDSVIKVKWDVEWFEESNDNSQDWSANEGGNGTWISSSARYYIRIANQLLVEDKDFGQETRGFVILTADLNVRLLNCHKGRGQEDFNRLINENTVQSSPEAAEAAAMALQTATPAKKDGNWTGSGGNGGVGGGGAAAKEGNKAGGGNTNKDGGAAGGKDNGGNGGGGANNQNSKDAPPSVRKLSDMSRGLRECLVEVLDDRDKNKKDSLKIADQYAAFALGGDLDAGLALVEHFQEVKSKAENSNSNSLQPEDEDKVDLAADDAMYLAQKLEKSLVKILRSGSELVNNPDEEIEMLRRGVKKLKKELEERDREIASLKKN